MSTGMFRLSAVIAFCLVNAASAVAGERPRQTPPADRGAYADPAAPYKADRLSSSRGQKVLDTPGQTTVPTPQLDPSAGGPGKRA